MFKRIVLSFAAVAGFAVLTSTIALATSTNRAYATNHSTNTNNACVDGSQRANISATWNAKDSISFKTVNGKLLCNDVTLYFSSYVMPDNYNGNGFTNNPTAVPQTIFASVSTIIKKGTNGAGSLKVNMPEACKNVQVDLYYGPEIKTVDKSGHGVQYITGKLFSKTVDSCTPVTPEEPEQPEEPEVPTVPTPEAQTPPTPPAVVTTPPVELPHTGSETVLPIALSVLVGGAIYAATLAISKRQ